jgi:hypothetical protein
MPAAKDKRNNEACKWFRGLQDIKLFRTGLAEKTILLRLKNRKKNRAEKIAKYGLTLTNLWAT